MSLNIFQTVKEAIGHLNPREAREEADRPVRLRLFAGSEVAYQQMEAFFTPTILSSQRRAELSAIIQRASNSLGSNDPQNDVDIFSQEIPTPENGFTFYILDPERTVKEILKARAELHLALARNVYPFREPVVDQLIRKVSKENAMFSLATAIPDIIPLISLPWAVGEFASDTAVLTANQIRLAFMLAAASDREIGYSEQKKEVGSILLSAFGWRAIARELVGKIPFGGGLIAKAAVAYAGTRVIGMSLDRYYRIGYGFTRPEREVAYQEALERGKTIAGSMLSGLKHREIVS